MKNIFNSKKFISFIVNAYFKQRFNYKIFNYITTSNFGSKYFFHRAYIINNYDFFFIDFFEEKKNYKNFFYIFLFLYVLHIYQLAQFLLVKIRFLKVLFFTLDFCCTFLH